jgi:lipopolysaccharide transport system permease protein
MKIIAQLALLLGWQDLRQAYRRSVVGPFWITAGMAVQIVAMGLVFSIIFKAKSEEYIPFLAVGIILWSFISSSLSESCNSLINSEAMIRQLELAPVTYVFRSIWKNLLTFAHHLVILPILFLVIRSQINLNLFLSIPGLILLFVNISWMSILLAMFSARYRDVPPIVSSVLTIIFYVSPIMWFPSLLPEGAAHLVLGLNPFYHLLQIVRLPLLGQSPTLENWTLSLVFAFTGSLIALISYKHFRRQLPYWI